MIAPGINPSPMIWLNVVPDLRYDGYLLQLYVVAAGERKGSGCEIRQGIASDCVEIGEALQREVFEPCGIVVVWGRKAEERGDKL